MVLGRSKKVTLADVAAEAGVSRTTASYILGQSQDRFAQDTIERVLGAAEKLGYRPNPIARSLRTGQTPLFGLVVPTDVGASQQHARCRIEVGIAERMRRNRMDMVQVTTSAEDSGIDRVSDLLESRLISGLIVNAPRETPLISWLSSQGAAFVVIGRPEAGDVISVDFDNAALGRASADHLLSLGHTDLLHIASEKASGSKDRAAGFTQRCADAGLAGRQVTVVRAEDSVAGGYKAMGDALASGLVVSGVCAGDDWIACGAVTAIRDAGMRVPEDISVVGCNNDCAACPDLRFLTTVDLDFAALGALAAQQLLSLLEGRPTSQRETLGFRLITRLSTCPANRP